MAWQAFSLPAQEPCPRHELTPAHCTGWVDAVRALLASYHRIDDTQTSEGLWIEATSARQWMSTASGDDTDPADPRSGRDGSSPRSNSPSDTF